MCLRQPSRRMSIKDFQHLSSRLLAQVKYLSICSTCKAQHHEKRLRDAPWFESSSHVSQASLVYGHPTCGKLLRARSR